MSNSSHCIARAINHTLIFQYLHNTLGTGTGTKVRLFTDDCIIYRTIKSEQNRKILQKDLSSTEKSVNW